MATKKTQQLPTKEKPVITFYQKTGEKIEQITFTGSWKEIEKSRLQDALESLKKDDILNKERIKELEKILQ